VATKDHSVADPNSYEYSDFWSIDKALESVIE
jgi:hypothetical protein